MEQIVVIEGELNLLSVLDGEMALNTLVDGEMDKVLMVDLNHPAYEGPYEVTPTRETQILETADLQMEHDVTFHPIPWYYGLITWDGTVLTVS